METNSATFIMIQWSPFPIVLPMSHPCVTNTQPVYIEKYDRVHRLDRRNIHQKSFVSQQEVTNQIPNPSNQPIKDNETTILESNISQNSSNASFIKRETELNTETNTGTNTGTNTDAFDPNQLFKPNERFNGDELLSLDISSIDDLVENLIPFGEISVLAGPGDSGKTTLYFQLALSIILNKEHFLGRKINSKFNAVLIIATEDSKIRIADKIRKQLKMIAPDFLTIKDLYVHITGDDHFNRIRIELSHKKFDLVVLDALGDLLLEDINSQTAVREFYKELEAIIREFNTTFLMIHHVGKTKNRSSKSNIIGSVAIVDRARNILMLDKDPKTGIRWLTIVKSNNISDELKNKPIFLKLDEDSLTYSLIETDNGFYNTNSENQKQSESVKKKELPQGEYIPFTEVVKNKPGRKFDYKKLAEAKMLHAQGMNLEDIGEKLGKHKSTISRWFKEHPTYDLSKDDVD